jgi:predicted DNA-binding protein
MKKRNIKSKVLGIRLDDETSKRIKYYASKSGRTPSSVARAVLERNANSLEKYFN